MKRGSRLRCSSVLINLSSSHGEGDEEGRGRAGAGDEEGHAARDEGDEGREHQAKGTFAKKAMKAAAMKAMKVVSTQAKGTFAKKAMKAAAMKAMKVVNTEAKGTFAK